MDSCCYCCKRSIRSNKRAGVGSRYAQTLAERGFLTIAFDPSYYGESGGTPRYLTSPEISTEDFSAAVLNLLSTSFHNLFPSYLKLS